jgi:RNA polymerase sigma factor for flagellar operon FliA
MVQQRIKLVEKGSIGARNQIIDAHIGLVYRIAKGMSRDFVHYADYDELVSCGMMGLIDAAENYDPTKGIQLKSYAAIRIRGAIIDAMRKRDWMPRNVRKRYEQIEQFCSDWCAKFGQPPTDAQIAAGLGLSEARVIQAKSRWSHRGFVSIEWAQEYGECHVVEQDDGAMPENALIRKERMAALGTALGSLPERQRQVVALSYFQGLTLKKIGDVLNVSESRVCQLRTKALVQLRKTMLDGQLAKN